MGRAAVRVVSTGTMARPTSLVRMSFGMFAKLRREGTGWPPSTATRTHSRARSVTWATASLSVSPYAARSPRSGMQATNRPSFSRLFWWLGSPGYQPRAPSIPREETRFSVDVGGWDWAWQASAIGLTSLYDACGLRPMRGNRSWNQARPRRTTRGSSAIWMSYPTRKSLTVVTRVTGATMPD